jgi:hypothetical protein
MLRFVSNYIIQGSKMLHEQNLLAIFIYSFTKLGHRNTFEVSVNLPAKGTVLFFLEYEEQIPEVVYDGKRRYGYKINIPPKVKDTSSFEF